MHLLEFSNNCNIKGAIYSTGFVHRLLIEPCFDTPLPQRNESLIEDDQGNITIKYSNIKEYCVFDICDIPDSMILTYNSIRDYSDIFLTDLQTGERSKITDFTFTAIDQDGCLNKGTVTALINNTVTTGCCDVEDVQIL